MVFLKIQKCQGVHANIKCPNVGAGVTGGTAGTSASQQAGSRQKGAWGSFIISFLP